MEVGIDLEKNSRFEKVSSKFVDRVFTKNEIAYAQRFSDPHTRLCAIWCAKEAVIKAFSGAKLSLKDIEVCHNDFGKPEINLTAKIEKELKKIDAKDIKISISHSIDYSTAICIIE